MGLSRDGTIADRVSAGSIASKCVETAIIPGYHGYRSCSIRVPAGRPRGQENGKPTIAKVGQCSRPARLFRRPSVDWRPSFSREADQREPDDDDDRRGDPHRSQGLAQYDHGDQGAEQDAGLAQGGDDRVGATVMAQMAIA